MNGLEYKHSLNLMGQDLYDKENMDMILLLLVGLEARIFC